MNYGAVIVETRPIENLHEIIQKKHLDFIPESWGLTLYLSKANMHLVDVGLFNRETHVIIIPEHLPASEYNKLLTSVSFWESLPYEKVLIFQTDSELLREGIEDYLQYDFIGAQDVRPGCEGMMNGGLSIRSVVACKEVCELNVYRGGDNEDWWFCKRLYNLPVGTIDPPFSVELKCIMGSLGYHAIDPYLTPDECKQIREQYK